ncbi:hypothetical protein BKA70DRAFT_1428896 [Coprinopsis sp. MPI-PUGE-AT-0042]|nr:hypothetical protein BKA70DRAFT_1428896 [Coprinopsis sp. MPI-PUGE-AT-0042]
MLEPSSTAARTDWGNPDVGQLAELGRQDGSITPLIESKIRHLIQQKTNQLLVIRKQIESEEIKWPRMDLEDAYCALKDGIENLESYLAPIRRVPVEILADIFLLAHGDDLIDFPAPSYRPPLPMTLAAVCFYWRTVSITLPHLWRYLALKCLCRAQHIGSDRAMVYPGLQMILERSQPLHMSVNVDWSWCSKNMPCVKVDLPLLQMKSQIETFHSSRFNFARFESDNLDFSSLKRLILDHHVPTTQLTSLSTPNLASLTVLRLWPGTGAFLNLQLNWLSLTELIVNWVNRGLTHASQAYGELARALTQMHNLEHLTTVQDIDIAEVLGQIYMRQLEKSSQHRFDGVSAGLPKLRTFRIEDPSGLLVRLNGPSMINTPSLETLHYVSRHSHWAGVNFHPLRNLLKSTSHLRTIRIITRDKPPTTSSKYSLVEITSAALRRTYAHGPSKHKDTLKYMLLTNGVLLDKAEGRYTGLADDGNPILRRFRIAGCEGEDKDVWNATASGVAESLIGDADTASFKPILDCLACVPGNWTLFIETRMND